MAKHSFLLAAIPALLLASCSDTDMVQNPDITPPGDANTLTLNVLSVSSQSGRFNLAKDTRGPKADRLQFVAELAPVATSDAAEKNWSATSVVVEGGKAYVTWHSNRQATAPATAWGGAIDVIDIDAIASGAALTNTVSTGDLKFNSAIADGTNLYLAATGSKNGAVIARLPLAGNGLSTTLSYIDIPGASANSLYKDGSSLVAVSGYAGAAVKIPAAFAEKKFDEANENEAHAVISPFADDFGGKYVAGGYILRTDASAAQIVPVDGTAPRTLDVPLVSAEKYAESYDPSTGEWTSNSGATATYYGKHVLAVADGYLYVGAGKNGLRAYAVSGGAAPVWSNGLYTAGVYADQKYVYAASGSGLRVYTRKADGTLELFAYEVNEYDADGNAASITAGANGHSANFVAVDPVSGYIFVAYGQTGVRVYRLNENSDPLPVEKEDRNISIPEINYNDTKKVEPGESADFTIPTTLPEPPAGNKFGGWSENPSDGNSPVYQPGAVVTVTPDHDVVLLPVYTEYEYVLSFEGNVPAGQTVTGVPATMYSDENTFTISGTAPVWEGHTFKGWSTDPAADIRDTEAVFYQPGASYTLPAGQKKVTLYGVWALSVTGGGSQGGGGDVPGGELGGGGSGTGGAGDVPPGSM